VSDTSGRNPEDIRIGGVVKALREAHGLSRAQVGDAIGKSGKLIAALEQGHRHATAPVQRLLVDFFGVPLDALYDAVLLAEYLEPLRREVRPEVVSAA
jgi:transcriptional regulator with XRE-family HTH domain